MTTSMRNQQGQGPGVAVQQAVAAIDCGYLPPDVAQALNQELRAQGFDTHDFSGGQMPPAFVRLAYDSNAAGGQKGWHLDVLVQQRQTIAAGAMSGDTDGGTPAALAPATDKGA